MSSPYQILEGRSIDQWKVTELKEELKRRKLKTGGLKEELVKRLDEAVRNDADQEDVPSDDDVDPAPLDEVTTEKQVAGTLHSDEPEENATPGDNLVKQIVVTTEPEKNTTLDDSLVKQNVLTNEPEKNTTLCDDFVTQNVATNDETEENAKLGDNSVKQNVVTNEPEKNTTLDDDLVKHNVLTNEPEKNTTLDDDLVKHNVLTNEPEKNTTLDGDLVKHNVLTSDPEDNMNTTLGDNLVKQDVVANEELNKGVETHVAYEGERLDASVSGNVQDVSSQAERVNEKLDDENLMSETIGDGASSNEENIEESEEDQFTVVETTEITVVETTEIVTETKEHMMSLSRQDSQDDLIPNESGDLKAKIDNEDSSALLVDSKVDTSDPNNQVSEVSPVLGFQVKSDSISTESVTINEKNELKDNIIADDVKIELDVKPEMVYPSSGNDVPDGGESHPMDVDEPLANKVYVEETGSGNAENEDLSKENDTGDLGSSEKLNLDRSSGDDFIEEDGMEGKQIESKPDSDEVSLRVREVDVSDSKEEGLVDIVGEDMPYEMNVVSVEEKNGTAAFSAKRKLEDHQVARNSDTPKRQRRWNSEGLKAPEQRSGDASITPKGAIQPAFKRSFSRSGSTASEEAPKDRIVPPSSKPPTYSLRIDRFLRPFTLKAVQELLGKTGTVTDFWMDHIKTHCYVSYSSVEEAAETRNAIYNLQWPPYGGHLLVAEFVDPLEVKARLEPPSQTQAPAPSPAPSPTPASAPSQQSVPPQPSPRLQVNRQQPQQPAMLPPPPLSNPPATARDQPPMKERLTLPPPPPLPEKVEPPIVTLDDLFRKTKATPRVYYLPLSEEQVAAKLQTQGKTVKQ